MKISNRRIISTVAIGAFMVSVAAGLVYGVSPASVIVRSLIAAAATGGAAALAVFIFEKVWTR